MGPGGRPPGPGPHTGRWPGPGQGGWEPPRLTTYQPGVIPFRPLLLGDIFGAAFKLVRGNLASTIGVAVLVVTGALLIATPLGVWVAGQARPAGSADFGVEDLMLSTTGSWLPTMAGSMSTVLLAGFIAYVTGQAVLGRKVKLPETWRGTRPHLLRIVGVSIVVWVLTTLTVLLFLAPGVGLAIAGGVQGDDAVIGFGVLTLLLLGLLLVPAMLFIWTRFAFVSPVVVLERAGIGTALRRSWRLTQFSGFWRVLGIRLLTALLVAILSQVLVMPLAFLMIGASLLGGDVSTFSPLQLLLLSLTTLLTAALTTPITASVDTLLYVDLRMRLENLDVQLMQAVDGVAPLPWLPALEQPGTARPGG